MEHIKYVIAEFVQVDHILYMISRLFHMIVTFE